MMYFLSKKHTPSLVLCSKPLYLCPRFNKAIDCLTKNLHNTMKKLVFMFVAMAAISFASCGGSDKAGAANDSIDSTAADSAAADSAAADSAVAADSVAAPVAADSAAA
ncbi:MAG: hypothetical protein SPK31_04940 [Alloprevotella sp.]|nr:hypothetical protein [Prevotellamassilia sp.]MDY5762430.1 hypothetical protein [Alloprevotella sp.]